MASWNLPDIMRIPAKIRPPKADDRARIDGERAEGRHQRGRPGEVHRPLGVGHARKRERKKGRSHRADGREKSGFEIVIRLPIGKRHGQPITSGYRIGGDGGIDSLCTSADRVRVSYGAKLWRNRCRVQ
jgi:hypothetical protein